MKIPGFIVLFVLLSCTFKPENSKGIIRNSNASAKDTVVLIGGFQVRIQRPETELSTNNTLLILPGWNFENTVWCDSTDLCKSALEKGIAVVAPQMKRSIYASQYYTETRADLKLNPTLTWLDSALDLLQQKHGLFSGRNYVLGLSTGGRGVALICEKKPGFFTAAAALSGDFDQYVLPNDRLSTLVYGPFAQFSGRWRTIDNPVFLIQNMKTPIYMGHSIPDKIVPYTQTVEFYDSLVHRYPGGFIPKSKRSAISVVSKYPDIYMHLDSALGHQFQYWRSELPAVWEFFESR
ncbi:MAG: alpha/beta hydrolase [Bacteroidetes bacterium]|nr:alpha/beta hydrolase [Bacteroidota bacterium]